MLAHNDAAALASRIIRFELLGEPVAKGRPRFTHSGRTYTPARSRHYENLLRLRASEVMHGSAPMEGAVRIKLDIFLPIPASWSKKRQRMALDGMLRPTTKPDLDNLLKSIADACNDIVWRDDRQIVDAIIAKSYSDRPRLALTAIEIS
jgi:Holliday junction resolvase RusA-like endonuclease